MRRHVRTAALLAIAALWTAAPCAAQDRARPELLVRIDDIGMNHSVNLGLRPR